MIRLFPLSVYVFVYHVPEMAERAGEREGERVVGARSTDYCRSFAGHTHTHTHTHTHKQPYFQESTSRAEERKGKSENNIFLSLLRSQLYLWVSPFWVRVEGIFPFESTWFLTPFPEDSFG